MPILKVFKIKEAAEYLNAHIETVRRLARRGEIPAFKMGKDWRFKQSDLDRWMETHHQRNRNAHILAVDDEEIFLNSLRRLLRKEPYRFSMATSGVQALELIRRDTPDVILLDLKMPGMSGPQILKEIRKIDKNLPVIIITGYPDGDLMQEALQYSPLLMLPKPVEFEQVINTVELALKGTQSQRVFFERAER